MHRAVVTTTFLDKLIQPSTDRQYPVFGRVANKAHASFQVSVGRPSPDERSGPNRCRQKRIKKVVKIQNRYFLLFVDVFPPIPRTPLMLRDMNRRSADGYNASITFCSPRRMALDALNRHFPHTHTSHDFFFFVSSPQVTIRSFHFFFNPNMMLDILVRKGRARLVSIKARILCGESKQCIGRRLVIAGAVLFAGLCIIPRNGLWA